MKVRVFQCSWNKQCMRIGEGDNSHSEWGITCNQTGGQELRKDTLTALLFDDFRAVNFFIFF